MGIAFDAGKADGCWHFALLPFASWLGGIGAWNREVGERTTGDIPSPIHLCRADTELFTMLWQPLHGGVRLKKGVRASGVINVRNSTLLLTCQTKPTRGGKIKSSRGSDKKYLVRELSYRRHVPILFFVCMSILYSGGTISQATPI